MRKIFEMTVGLWVELRAQMEDVDRRVEMGCRIEHGPETVDGIWASAQEIAEDVIRRNGAQPVRRAG